MKSIILFWAEHGVRIFRVDNPHTKPVAFWEYLICGVRAKFPDTIFLSEAFTKPKMMKALAKAGFTQSYTYFTWRTSKQELTEYFTELTQTEMREYFRGNLWPNTPDILPFHLQEGGRPAFMIRAVSPRRSRAFTASTADSSFAKTHALPGREEYLDSEKYQWKERDWDAPGNIKEWITRLNRIRQRESRPPFLRQSAFLSGGKRCDSFYGKMTPARDNIILVVVNLDPHQHANCLRRRSPGRFRARRRRSYQVHDLLTDARYIWRGRRNYVELDPRSRNRRHIFRVRRWSVGWWPIRVCRATSCIPSTAVYAKRQFQHENFLLLLALLAGATPVLAQSSDARCAGSPAHDHRFFEAMIAAGPVMVPLFPALGFFSHARRRLFPYHSARRGCFERLHGNGRRALAQTRLSRVARCFQSPWRSDRARRAKDARFYDEESAAPISARCARSRKRKARASRPISTIASLISPTSG